MAFEAGPVNPQPHTITTFSTPNDRRDVLPEPALVKMTALKQRCLDLHGAIPPFEDVQEQSYTTIRHQKRIDDLTRVRAEGGHGLPVLAPEVVIERRALERHKRTATAAAAQGNPHRTMDDCRTA